MSIILNPSPIKVHNSFSLFDDAAINKLNDVLNNQDTTIKVTASYDEAEQVAAQSKLEGYKTSIVERNNSYFVNVKPRVEVQLDEALSSGQFKKLAFGRYAFKKVANNPLGIQHYNFDDGTIWKVMAGKDGKQYLVKEVDDNDSEKVIRSLDKNYTKATILASSNTNIKQLVRLAKVLYDNPSDEFINDLLNVSKDVVSKVLTAKLNRIINSELAALNITSPLYRKKVQEKVAHAISSNTVFNKQQISNIIADLNKINVDSLTNI